ncbi:hypothetical protein [Streptomyces sp. A1277]|nr:hypothetical protein [Streptomyces sp. A1277]
MRKIPCCDQEYLPPREGRDGHQRGHLTLTGEAALRQVDAEALAEEPQGH